MRPSQHRWQRVPSSTPLPSSASRHCSPRRPTCSATVPSCTARCAPRGTARTTSRSTPRRSPASSPTRRMGRQQAAPLKRADRPGRQGEARRRRRPPRASSWRWASPAPRPRARWPSLVTISPGGSPCCSRSPEAAAVPATAAPAKAALRPRPAVRSCPRTRLTGCCPEAAQARAGSTCPPACRQRCRRWSTWASRQSRPPRRCSRPTAPWRRLPRTSPPPTQPPRTHPRTSRRRRCRRPQPYRPRRRHPPRRCRTPAMQRSAAAAVRAQVPAERPTTVPLPSWWGWASTLRLVPRRCAGARATPRRQSSSCSTIPTGWPHRPRHPHPCRSRLQWPSARLQPPPRRPYGAQRSSHQKCSTPARVCRHPPPYSRPSPTKPTCGRWWTWASARRRPARRSPTPTATRT
mmetsp:Transcript_25620/g.80923  ORF Transcript_25620/g.80923 Transcript_25620/m.80923 type:complete len:406 (-) Transcript_25620:753-1970(-)